MISTSNGRFRVRARGFIAGLVMTAATAAVLVIPGTASASKVNCAGSVEKSAERPTSKKAAQYQFICDKPVLGYTVTFNKQLTLFDPEVLPTTPTGEASGELVSCEGDFPGYGIGCTAQSSSCPGASSPYTQCTGDIDYGNKVTSEFETTKAYCVKKKKGRGKPTPLSAYLIVSTLETNANGKSYVNSSQPFRLANNLGCKPPKPQHHS